MCTPQTGGPETFFSKHCSAIYSSRLDLPHNYSGNICTKCERNELRMQPLWRTKPSHFSIFDLSRAGEALSKNVKFRMRQTSGSPYARRHFAEKKVVRFYDTWLCSRWFRQIAAWRGKHLPFFTAEWRAIAKSGGRILYHPPVTTRRLIKKQIGNLLRRGRCPHG